MSHPIPILTYSCFVLQGDGETDFKIGDEMRVVLSSFSRMGIPVVSVVDDK